MLWAYYILWVAEQLWTLGGQWEGCWWRLTINKNNVLPSWWFIDPTLFIFLVDHKLTLYIPPPTVLEYVTPNCAKNQWETLCLIKTKLIQNMNTWICVYWNSKLILKLSLNNHSIGNGNNNYNLYPAFFSFAVGYINIISMTHNCCYTHKESKAV